MFQRLQNRVLAASVALVAALPALATPTDPFDTVVTDVTDKVTSYGGALVVLAGVGLIFMIGIKYIKKIRGAA